MTNIVKQAIDAVERALFGATVEERAQMQADLLLASIARALDVGPNYDAHFDAAYEAALARGLSERDAAWEATGIADEMDRTPQLEGSEA